MNCRRCLRIHTVLACLQAGLATALVVSRPAVAAVRVREFVPAEDAQQHLQETNMVCGVVAGTRYADSSQPRLTYLNLGRPYPNQVFTVVIPEPVRPKFGVRPEDFYKGKAVCVTGLITAGRGKPQIVIDNPSQIEVEEMPASTNSLPADSSSK